MRSPRSFAWRPWTSFLALALLCPLLDAVRVGLDDLPTKDQVRIATSVLFR